MIPYKSDYYEYYPSCERFGNFIIPNGKEMFIYINDTTMKGVEPCRYAVSNLVRVYDYKKQEFVKISYATLYPSVNLYNYIKDRIVTNSLHRVYMIAFCYFPGCEAYEVNHIDGNKLNFHPSNLEWVTHRENMEHASEYLMQEKRKLSDDDIIEIISLYNNGNSMKSIAEKFNVSPSYISDILSNKIGSKRMNKLITNNPITRESSIKLTPDKIKEIAQRYNNGEEYYKLASEYDVDRSSLTKAIKRYAKSHPGEVELRALKKFTPEMAKDACSFFEKNINMNYDMILLYNSCLDELGLENTESNRKALKNLYHRKTYKDISSKYKF